MSTSDEIESRLREVKAKRGYMLPHHGLLAITSPRMLEAYDNAYTELALAPRVLSAHDREFVWLAILIATDEALATHHIAKFLAAGGTMAEVEAVLRLAAWAMGGRAYGFVEAHWLPHLAGLDLDAAYARAMPGGDRLSLMAAACVHACLADWPQFARAVVLAYARSVAEEELAEAVSLVMFPGSVPRFVEAARVWLALIRDGRVTPGPAFAAWAALQGQGGWDEAQGSITPPASSPRTSPRS